jgi:hypothetical protein
MERKDSRVYVEIVVRLTTGPEVAFQFEGIEFDRACTDIVELTRLIGVSDVKAYASVDEHFRAVLVRCYSRTSAILSEMSPLWKSKTRGLRLRYREVFLDDPEYDGESNIDFQVDVRLIPGPSLDMHLITDESTELDESVIHNILSLERATSDDADIISTLKTYLPVALARLVTEHTDYACMTRVRIYLRTGGLGYNVIYTAVRLLSIVPSGAAPDPPLLFKLISCDYVSDTAAMAAFAEMLKTRAMTGGHRPPRRLDQMQGCLLELRRFAVFAVISGDYTRFDSHGGILKVNGSPVFNYSMVVATEPFTVPTAWAPPHGHAYEERLRRMPPLAVKRSGLQDVDYSVLKERKLGDDD